MDGGGGSCILSCILCYPVHIQFGVVRGAIMPNSTTSVRCWYGWGTYRDWLWKRSGWTGGWFELAVVVGLVQKPTQEVTWGGGECGAGWSSSHVDIYSWRLNWSSDCYSAATVALSFLSFFYHCCDVIMMMVLLVVVGQKGRWWRASWRRWRRDGRTGIVSWIETRWIIMGCGEEEME